MTDIETFKFVIFAIGNGAHQTTPQNWSLRRSTGRIKGLQRKEPDSYRLDLYENKETKSSTWFYYDLIHNDWRFLNGIKRYINN
jgi:hypothetical protein